MNHELCKLFEFWQNSYYYVNDYIRVALELALILNDQLTTNVCVLRISP